MDKLAIHQKERGERIEHFATDNPQAFSDPTSDASQDLAEIKTQVLFLQSGGVGQISGAGQSSGATAAKTQLLAKMEKDIRALRRTFGRIKTRDSSLSFDLNLPADGKEQTVVDTAKSYIAQITPIKAKFIARGKKADFLDALNNDLLLYAQLVTAQQTGQGGSQNETAAIEESVKNLVDAIEGLDDIMDNFYEDNPDKLREWNRIAELGTIARQPGHATPPSLS